MRGISLIAVVLFCCLGCNSTKKTAVTSFQNPATLVIEYEANTRGFYQKIVVKNQKVSSTNDRSGKETLSFQNISISDWNFLLAEINKLNLPNLSKLKAPTEKRFYDGAAIAVFRVSTAEGIYETTNFDHGFPPSEIKTVVELVNVLYKAER